MPCRGVRGAVTVCENTVEEIVAQTRVLLEQIVTENGIQVDDVASVIFSATPDINAICPARAAREMGWMQTPLLCVQEMAVPGSLPHCIRILLHWNTDRTIDQIRHVYLGEAQQLRPDWVKKKTNN